MLLILDSFPKIPSDKIKRQVTNDRCKYSYYNESYGENIIYSHYALKMNTKLIESLDKIFHQLQLNGDSNYFEGCWAEVDTQDITKVLFLPKYKEIRENFLFKKFGKDLNTYKIAARREIFLFHFSNQILNNVDNIVKKLSYSNFGEFLKLNRLGILDSDTSTKLISKAENDRFEALYLLNMLDNLEKITGIKLTVEDRMEFTGRLAESDKKFPKITKKQLEEKKRPRLMRKKFSEKVSYKK